MDSKAVRERDAADIEQAMKRAALEATEAIKGGHYKMRNPQAERNRRKAQRRAQKASRRKNR